MTVEVERMLARSVFRAVAPEARRELAAASRLETFEPHGVVLSEGKPSSCVYLLVSGAIRVFHLSAGGLEVVVMFCRAPSLFGEIEAVLGIPHIENVTALERSELLFIPNDRFLHHLECDAAFARTMVADVCAKLAMASHNQKALAFQDISTRLATLLISYAAFDGKRMLDGIELELPITQDDMANALGITRRAVSKTITRWLDGGLISRRGGRYVLHKIRELTELAAAAHIGLGYDNQTGLTIIQPESATFDPWSARPI
jgi:CRP-like cAMP-binding protein